MAWQGARNCVYHVRKWRRFEEDLPYRSSVGAVTMTAAAAALFCVTRDETSDHVGERVTCATRPHAAEFK